MKFNYIKCPNCGSILFKWERDYFDPKKGGTTIISKCGCGVTCEQFVPLIKEGKQCITYY